jgi:hypothetical protein
MENVLIYDKVVSAWLGREWIYYKRGVRLKWMRGEES